MYRKFITIVEELVDNEDRIFIAATREEGQFGLCWKPDSLDDNKSYIFLPIDFHQDFEPCLPETLTFIENLPKELIRSLDEELEQQKKEASI